MAFLASVMPSRGTAVTCNDAPQITNNNRRADEIDVHAVDKTIHHHHRAAGELWRFCFARGGGSHPEFIAGLLDRMAADAETIDWWERATPRPRQ